MKTKVIPIALSVVGVIPFIIFALYNQTSIGYHAVRWFGYYPDIKRLAVTYSALLLTFHAGINWGVLAGNPVSFKSYGRKLIYMWSGIIVVASWIVILSTSNLFSLYLVIAAFVFQILIDRIISRFGLMAKWLFRIKLLTAITAIICIVMMAVGR